MTTLDATLAGLAERIDHADADTLATIATHVLTAVHDVVAEIDTWRQRHPSAIGGDRLGGDHIRGAAIRHVITAALPAADSHAERRTEAGEGDRSSSRAGVADLSVTYAAAVAAHQAWSGCACDCKLGPTAADRRAAAAVLRIAADRLRAHAEIDMWPRGIYEAADVLTEEVDRG